MQPKKLKTKRTSLNLHIEEVMTYIEYLVSSHIWMSIGPTLFLKLTIVSLVTMFQLRFYFEQESHYKDQSNSLSFLFHSCQHLKLLSSMTKIKKIGYINKYSRTTFPTKKTREKKLSKLQFLTCY